MGWDDTNVVDRRTVLKTAAGAAGMATVGSSLAAASPPEEECDDDYERIRQPDCGGGGGGGRDYDFPVASTKGHFYIDTDCGWFGICGFSEHLKEGHNEYDYDRRGPIDWDADEMIVYCHGWRSETHSDAVEGAKEVTHALDNPIPTGVDAWDGAFTAFSWDSSIQPGPEMFGIAYEDQEDVGYRNGKKAANFVTDVMDEGNTDTDVHWVAHSMGGHVTFGLIEELAANDREIETITLWAPAVPREWPNLDNYGYEIEEVCREMNVVHSHDDAVLEDIYKIETGNDALGARGCKGEKPCNYTDHDHTQWFTGAAIDCQLADQECAHLSYHNGDREGRFAAGITLDYIRSREDTADCDSDSGGGGWWGGCDSWYCWW